MGSTYGNQLGAIALKILEPEVVTRQRLAYHIRRAKRLRVYWLVLNPMERALVEAALLSKIDVFRGEVIRSLLARLIARLELQTMRGKVLLIGLKRALSKVSGFVVQGFSRLLDWAKGKIDYILYLGRNMIALESYFAVRRGY